MLLLFKTPVHEYSLFLKSKTWFLKNMKKNREEQRIIYYYLHNSATACKLINRVRPAQMPSRPNLGVATSRNIDETAPAKNWKNKDSTQLGWQSCVEVITDCVMCDSIEDIIMRQSRIMNQNRRICSIGKVRNTMVEPISHKCNSIHWLRNSDKLQNPTTVNINRCRFLQKLSVNFSFLKHVLTQTPEHAMSRTARLSIKNEDKDPNPTNKEAARATPVTPPTYNERRNNISSLRRRIKW
jgi:hypothetical protein